jgi:membrane protein
LIYKILPDVQIAWRDVLLGAALTSLLFSVGKFLIGLYLGRSTVAAVYGAAGSLVTVLLWVYYSALIVFYGAEITQLYATQLGSGLAANELSEEADPADGKS